MGKMSLTSCRALSTPGKFSNVDRYDEAWRSVHVYFKYCDISSGRNRDSQGTVESKQGTVRHIR